MSWFKDTKWKWIFKCPAEHETRVEATDQPECPKCSECGEATQYCGFEPIKLGIATKISYDQNGIQAYKISTGKGTATHMSRTRYELNDTGKIKDYYIKAKEEKMAKGKV